MIDTTGKSFHRLDMQPGCSLMPRADHHVGATGYGQLEPAVAGVPCWRYALGGMPTSSVNRVLKVPSDEQPTAKQTSVTLRSPRRSRAIARPMRRVIR